MDEGDVKRHFVWRRRRLGLVVAVAEERDEEERAPEDEVRDGDDHKHFDAGQALALHFC